MARNNPPISQRHPLFKLVRVFVKDLDENPAVQLKIHTVGFWYWTANFPVVTYLFFCQPRLWLQYGLFITLIYSIYANWTSDYTGMSASQSVINTAQVDIEAENATIELKANEE